MRHKQPDKLDSLIGWAATFIVAALILMFLGLLSSVADAAPVCSSRACVKQAAVIQQAVAYPPVYYQVGQSAQREAIATAEFRHSEEYIELQQLRGFKAGVDAVAAVSGDRPSSPAGLANKKGGDNPAGAEQPPAEPANGFAARYPTLAAKCSKCHSGDTPKGDVFIDGSVPLDGPDAAPKRDAIAAAIVNLRMPQGQPLGPQEQYNALVELFAETTPPEGE